MKTKIPPGTYTITIEHHPNQPGRVFLATIKDAGEYKGKGIPLCCRCFRKEPK